MIKINDTTYPAIGTWNDLSLLQALRLHSIITDGKALWSYNQSAFIGHQQLFLVLKTLLGDDQVHAWHQDCLTAYGPEEGALIFIEEALQVAAQYDGLFTRIEKDEVADDAFILDANLSLTKCPYPALGHFYAPSDGLENVSIYELGTIFTLYESLVRTLAVDDAMQLLATIYRPAKPDTPENQANNYEGDIRLPFRKHESTVSHRQHYFQSLPHQSIGLIVLWIASCRHSIITEHPNLFKPQHDVSTQNPNVQQVGNQYGWAGTLLSLAGGLQNLDAIADQPWRNAFIYMAMLEDQRKLHEFQANKK